MTPPRRRCHLPAVLVCLTLAASPVVHAEPAPRTGPPETTSLLDTPLHARPRGADPKAEELLQNARTIVSLRPDHPDAHLWLGRRYGYLWRMNDAVDAFSRGMEKFPDDPRFYRHRGHRLISLRRFEEAQRDLERAAELIATNPDLGAQIEPDGQPNPAGVPLTTTGFNTFYHLALARYLQADYEGALAAWRRTLDHARGLPDNTVAASYWMYLTLRKLGRDDEAAELLGSVPEDPDLLENHTYHRLLVHFRAGDDAVAEAERDLPESDLDFATLTAGIGHFHLLAGRENEARAAYEKVIARGNWPAFGHIAAEAELARLRP